MQSKRKKSFDSSVGILLIFYISSSFSYFYLCKGMSWGEATVFIMQKQTESRPRKCAENVPNEMDK